MTDQGASPEQRPEQPTNQFGTPIGPPVPPTGPPAPQPGPQPPPPPGQWPAAGGYGITPPPAYPPSRRGMSTGAKVGIAIGGSILALVVLGIAAAVVIGVVDNNRTKAQASRTTVTLPAQIGSYTQVTSSVADELKQQAQSVPKDWGTPQTAVYGTAQTPKIIVLAGAHAINTAGRSSFLAGATKSAATAGFTLKDTDPGPLGGTMICGADASSIETACIFVDAGAYGRIEVAGTGPTALDLVRQVRAAVEHRS